MKKLGLCFTMAVCFLRTLLSSEIIGSFPQIVTLEGWSEIMYFVMDTHSFWSFIFFVFVTIVSI